VTFVTCAFFIGVFAYPPSHFSKGTGKAVPLQAWSSPDYMKTAQDGGKVVSPTHQPPLLPEDDPGTHFC